jgi:rhamnose utilization protein RhaD (predicted bifunctional aldolase and dehydrogenase)/NAD(P)-dependent dehydrogenase (short-subunit alcohol dehydrogenase family)
VENRYKDDDATRACQQFGGDTVLAMRTYTARLLGKNPNLVLHGGGNTSAKSKTLDRLGRDVDVLYIKGSGWDLATIEPAGHPAVRLVPLLELRGLDELSDEDMVAELRRNLLDPSAPTPSVETLLHAFLPARFIDHTHADAVLALADQPEAEEICRKAFGEALVWVPYVMPGFLLAKRTADAYDAAIRNGKTPRVIVLEKHGIFTFGESAKESYARMIEAVSRAERAIADRRHTVAVVPGSRVNSMESRVLPRLRGALARAGGFSSERGPVLVVRNEDFVLEFMNRRDAPSLVSTGCVTPDHVIRTGPEALFLEHAEYNDLDALGARFEADVAEHARKYDAYFDEMCAKKNVKKTRLANWPRVVLLPNLGMCAVGATLQEANVIADVYEHAMLVMADAADVGRFRPVSREDLFDVEYWSLEQAKIKKTAPSRLTGAIALVTGAASGIGLATAEAFIANGAHVVLADRDGQGVEQAASRLGSRATFVRGDVTMESEARAAVAHASRTFGGLDIVVSNAGTASEGKLDTREGADALRASLETNLLSHNHTARAASEVFAAQQNGGCLLFNASKSAFAPGPGFGPYAVAKSALIALMRQYAIDCGPIGVRSNAVNADRVRTALFGGGFAESRANARGISVEEYFKTNLLHREVTAQDVADAFVYLAEARSTTGCVITVDGGNSQAFPR